jgi:hypothetical protein
MDADKFVLTVIMGLVIAVVVAVSLAVAKRFKIELPWDARIKGCPRCGAVEDFTPGTAQDMIGTDGPVVRGKPRSDSMDDLIKVVAVMGGIGATLAGCVLLLSGVASWVVAASGMSLAERALVGALGVGAAIIAIPLGIQAAMWGWRRGFFPPVVKCKACGWRDPKYAL